MSDEEVDGGLIHVAGLGETSFDIAGTIEKLVAARSYNKLSLESDQTEVEYDLQAWNELEPLATTLTDSLDDLREWETWNTMSATSSDETILTATASSSAVPNDYLINVIQMARAQNVGSSKMADLTTDGTASTDLVAAGVLAVGDSFTIEGQTVTIGDGETLNSLVGKINTAAESMGDSNKVMATILDNRLVIMREETGTQDINVSEISGGPLEKLGVLDSLGDFKNELIAPQEAQFTVNGALVTRESNTGLDDVISGVTLNLESESDGDTITLKIRHDTDDARAKIEAFVESYNAFAEKCRFYTQKPLTGESSDGATIEALGELYNDSALQSIERNIRSQATASKYPYLNQTNAEYEYEGKTGVADSLEDIGVWTIGESNSLSIDDEDKLDYMLENEFEVVAQVFRGVYDANEGYVHGVASDFYVYANSVSESLTGQIATRTKVLEDDITEIEERIALQEEQLDSYETRLWTAFTAMEETQQKMSSDLSWLASQISTPS
ncbi:MAG: hypothetical protein EOL87_04860 [Spartobacteria bacterium]|nr:hypothetical protein [Spartobacteria bacterium]